MSLPKARLGSGIGVEETASGDPFLGHIKQTMRLLRSIGDDPQLERYNDETHVPAYAILSHTWMDEHDEVSFADLSHLVDAKTKAGWSKVQSARRQALHDGYEYLWVDTCCIDKTSSAELTEAIASMWRWYNNPGACYVYLPDLRPDSYTAWAPTEAKSLAEDERARLQHQSASLRLLQALYRCRWFSRGWTLQEMLAPPAPENVRFFDSHWTEIGNRSSLAEDLAKVTGVDLACLRGSQRLDSYSVAQRMSWAARRKTTRVEDRAYSLLGIFNVNIPIMYGEGHKAFLRLQEEILRTHSDHTIFVWDWREADAISYPDMDSSHLFAPSPDAFKRYRHVVPLRHREQSDCEITNAGVRLKVQLLFEDSAIMTGALRDVTSSQRKNHTAAISTSSLRWAVLHCREAMEQKAYALTVLPKGNGSDQYVVHGSHRIVEIDPLAQSSNSKMALVHLRRSDDRHFVSPAERQPQRLVLRCVDDGTTSQLQITEVRNGESSPPSKRAEWCSSDGSIAHEVFVVCLGKPCAVLSFHVATDVAGSDDIAGAALDLQSFTKNARAHHKSKAGAGQHLAKLGDYSLRRSVWLSLNRLLFAELIVRQLLDEQVYILELYIVRPEQALVKECRDYAWLRLLEHSIRSMVLPPSEVFSGITGTDSLPRSLSALQHVIFRTIGHCWFFTDLIILPWAIVLRETYTMKQRVSTSGPGKPLGDINGRTVKSPAPSESYGQMLVSVAIRETSLSFEMLMTANDRLALDSPPVSALLSENLARFRLLADDIGAHYTMKDKRSVDYRLGEAPRLKRRILELLLGVTENNTDLLKALKQQFANTEGNDA